MAPKQHTLSDKLEAALGYWREPLSGLQADSKLTWRAPGREGLQVWIGLLGDQPVARISRQPGHGSGCSGALNGWMWTAQEPGSAAQRLGVKETPTRGFASVPAAKRAIEAALAVAAEPSRRAGPQPRIEVGGGRRLIDGSMAAELGGAQTLRLETRCPEKWLAVDLETGDVWRGTTSGWKRLEEHKRQALSGLLGPSQ